MFGWGEICGNRCSDQKQLAWKCLKARLHDVCSVTVVSDLNAAYVSVGKTKGGNMGKTKVCWRRDFWKVNGHVGRRPLTFCRGQVKRLGANKWAGHPALQAHVIVRGEASDKGGKNDWHLQDATFIPWLSIFLQLVARREWQQPTDNSFSIQSNTKTLNNT